MTASLRPLVLVALLATALFVFGATTRTGEHDRLSLRDHSSNHSSRRLSTYQSGVTVTTVTGTCGTSGSQDGTGVGALFNGPFGMAIDTSFSTLYIGDQNNHKIRKLVIATGILSASDLGPFTRFAPPFGLDCQTV
jgi:hypothetical protein